MSQETIETLRRERDSLKQALADQTAQVEAVNKEFEQFSHSLSHDLRAPLRALEGFAQIIVEDYSANLDPEGKRCVNILSSSARKASLLIEDLLVLSRLCRQPFKPSNVVMRDLAAQAVTALKEEGANAQFEIGNLPDCLGDAGLIAKVFEQLLRNAVKFSQKNPLPRIEISGTIDGKRAVYSVRDNGIGFDPKYRSRLFGIFQRVHNDPEIDGRGIGLAIVNRLVHRNGGEVSAEGALQQGATFSFSLPLAPALESPKN